MLELQVRVAPLPKVKVEVPVRPTLPETVMGPVDETVEPSKLAEPLIEREPPTEMDEPEEVEQSPSIVALPVREVAELVPRLSAP